MSRRLSDAIVDGLCGMCHRLTRLCTCDNSSTDGSQHGGIQSGAVAPAPAPASAPSPASAPAPAPASAPSPIPPPQVPRTDTKDDWKQTDQYPQTYGRIQADGAQRRTWMLDATAPSCSIQACTLTFEDMFALYPDRLKPSHKDPHEDFEDQIIELGLPDPANTSEPMDSDPATQSPYWRFTIMSGGLDWVGYTGQGAIFIMAMYRYDKTTPHISDIARAFYCRDFDIGSLRHIFFHDVVEQQTSEFADDVLYTYNIGTLGESSTENDRFNWTHDANSAEFEALLGTNVGKIASALVLGAFPRGTRVINRVVIWYTQADFVRMNMYMRFDIEDVAS